MIQSLNNAADRMTKDPLLLYLLGANLQKNKVNCKNGISTRLYNKAVSVILRFWPNIRSHCGIGQLNLWGINHIPFRFGEVIFAESVKESSENEDETMLGNRVLVDTIMNCGMLTDRYKVKLKPFLLFPPTDISAVIRDFHDRDMPLDDYAFILRFSDFISTLDDTDISSIATCPTQRDCIKAMRNELSIYIYDIEQFLLWIKKSEKASDLEKAIGYLNKAFACADEIPKKKYWYLSIRGIRSKANEWTILSENEKNLVLSCLSFNGITDQISNIEKYSHYFKGFISLTLNILESMHQKPSLTRDGNTLSPAAIQELKKDLDLLRGKEKGIDSHCKTIFSQMDNVTERDGAIYTLEAIHHILLDHLEKDLLPRKYDSDEIFNYDYEK